MLTKPLIFQTIGLKAFELRVRQGLSLTFPESEASTRNDDMLNCSSLRTALRRFETATRKQVFNALRHGQYEGRLILATKRDVLENHNEVEVLWKFVSETGNVVGVSRNLNSRVNFSLEPSGQDEKDAGEPTRTSHSSTRYKPAVEQVGRLSAAQRLTQLNIALEGAQLGFWDWDETTDILQVNRHWAEMLGLGLGDVRRGSGFFQLLHPEDVAGVRQALMKYKRGQTKLYQCHFRLRHAKGHYIPIEGVGAYQKRENGMGEKSFHLVGIHRNRSEEVLREMALDSALEEAQNMSSAKSRFLARVSHEIRTPLHGVQNLIQLAVNGEDGKTNDRYLQDALTTIRGLSYVLDGLVDFAYMESIPITPEYRLVNISSLVELSRCFYEEQAMEKGLILRTNIDPTLGPLHYSDEKLLTQIMLGLTGNAVKYTEQGEVTVSAKVIKRSERIDKPDSWIDTIEIAVTDTGPGMSAEDFKQYLTAYRKDRDDSRSRSGQGLGIGISLVGGCVNALGGSITLRNNHASGTCIVVTINAKGMGSRVEPQPRRTDENTLVQETRNVIKTVLVVDDIQLNRMVLRTQLEQLGMDVFEADSAATALKFFEASPQACDLVLMDIQMPEMDGITCTQKLRRELHVEVPIVGITADATPDTHSDGLYAGMNEVLFKPLNISALIKAIGMQDYIFDQARKIT